MGSPGSRARRFRTCHGSPTARGPPANPVARFPDGEDAWLVVASAGGSAHHPAWYHNIAAHPDQVWIEFGGRQLRVTPAQLDGDARAQAWQRITQLQPRYAGYEQKTDRAIPVIRLARTD